MTLSAGQAKTRPFRLWHANYSERRYSARKRNTTGCYTTGTVHEVILSQYLPSLDGNYELTSTNKMTNSKITSKKHKCTTAHSRSEYIHSYTLSNHMKSANTKQSNATSATQQQQQQRPFNGLWSGTTRVGRYQKKHSPTHTHPNQRASFITFLHLQRSMASSLFNLRA